MKDSEYLLMLASIAIAPHLSKGWGLFTWFINIVGFLLLMYLERNT